MAATTCEEVRMNRAVWEVISGIPFQIYKVTTDFSPMGKFSKMDFGYDTLKTEDGKTKVLRFEFLFNFSPELLESPQVRPDNCKESLRNLIKVLKKCRNEYWPLVNGSLENETIANLATKVFTPLCSNDIILASKYSEDVKNIGCENIGIGSSHTWHGTPDMRVMGCDVITPVVIDNDVIDESEGVNEGKTALCFAKSIPKLVSACVVSSFTLHKLHPHMNPLVPSILIDNNSFQVCLYDCVKDILLISEPKNLSTKEGLSRSGLLFLWIVLNHR